MDSVGFPHLSKTPLTDFPTHTFSHALRGSGEVPSVFSPGTCCKAALAG